MEDVKSMPDPHLMISNVNQLYETRPAVSRLASLFSAQENSGRLSTKTIRWWGQTWGENT